MEEDKAEASPGRRLSAVAMDDEGSSSPAASYIRLVQHLIEKCICYKLNKEECMETLEKHAKIMPIITSTVWKELEKENREFFETYKKGRGEEATQKNPSDEQQRPSASKSSNDDDGDDQGRTYSSGSSPSCYSGAESGAPSKFSLKFLDMDKEGRRENKDGRSSQPQLCVDSCSSTSATGDDD